MPANTIFLAKSDGNLVVDEVNPSYDQSEVFYLGSYATLTANQDSYNEGGTNYIVTLPVSLSRFKQVTFFVSYKRNAVGSGETVTFKFTPEVSPIVLATDPVWYTMVDAAGADLGYELTNATATVYYKALPVQYANGLYMRLSVLGKLTGDADVACTVTAHACAVP